MHAFIFFSVYERLFDPIARELMQRYGVDRFSGFCWGRDQQTFLEQSEIKYEPLFVFSRDILPHVPAAPDVEYLARCETRYATPINRIISAERHLLDGRTQDQVLALVETIFRHVERTFTEHKPDFVFSENVSCMTSLIHHIVARANGVPFFSIGQSRISNPVIISRDGLQDYAQVRDRFVDLHARGLTADERELAREFVATFRNRPSKPAGQDVHGQVPKPRPRDVRILKTLLTSSLDDGNPTTITARRAVTNRLRRLARISVANISSLFETEPRLDVPYVLYPLHVQPEASTLVQAPYYLDQVALIDDIARSLPVGFRLYVKEHGASRGRRPLDVYRRIKSVFGVHLLGPDTPTWPLIQHAAAIVVITGTMGWEAVMLEKPVITCGSVFFNDLPFVYKANEVPKDGWAALFRKAIFEHRHDEERLLEFVTALLASTHRGEMHNPATIPRVAEPANIQQLTDALALEVGLHRTSRSRAASH